MFTLNTSLNPSNVWKNIQNNLMFGSTLGFWGKLALTAFSLFQGRKARKRSGGAEGKQTALTQEQIDFAKKNYEDYKAQYGGIDQDLIDSIDEYAAQNTLGRYTGEGVSDVRQSFAGARDRSNRQMTRYGLDPGDQRFMQGEREMALDESKADVFARNQAREKVQEGEDKLFARRIAAGQYGKQSSDKERAVMGAIGQSADLYGKQASGYAKQAGQGYGLAGQFLGKAIDSYGGGGGDGGYDLFPGATGSVLNEPVWEGSNSISDADTGDLGW